MMMMMMRGRIGRQTGTGACLFEGVIFVTDSTHALISSISLLPKFLTLALPPMALTLS